MDLHIAKITSDVKLSDALTRQLETSRLHAQSYDELVTNEYKVLSGTEGAIANAVTPSDVHVSSSSQSVKEAQKKLTVISENVAIQQRSLQIELEQNRENLKRSKGLKEQKENEIKKCKQRIEHEERQHALYTELAKGAQADVDKYEKKGNEALERTMISGGFAATGGLLLLGAIAAPVTGGLSLAVAAGTAGVGAGVAAGGTVSAVINGVEYAEMKEQIKTYTQKANEARVNQAQCQMEGAELERNIKSLEQEIGSAEETMKDVQNMLDIYFLLVTELHQVLKRFQETDVAMHAAAIETEYFRKIQRAFTKHSNHTGKFDKYMNNLKEKWREMQDVIHFQHKRMIQP
ncbi:uncharacterized protein LOC128219801 [Mya arenaria]|uniref:uncharacterized protein LOC128219801 n=1 Tax=Mya arenaria TaxID=6604 RepID=UPI0022E45592|nr:uncharacterized protein LOC128219801 [Mya arenaria]